MSINPLAGLVELLQMGLAWLFPLLYVVGAVICIRFRYLSPRLTIVLVGCVGQVIAAGFRLAAFIVPHYLSMDLRTYFLLPSLVSFVSTGLIVGGLAAVLADLGRQLNATGGRPYIPRAGSATPIPEQQDLAPWRARQPGSREIQE